VSADMTSAAMRLRRSAGIRPLICLIGDITAA
jgi:hypothetical protein